MPGRIEIRKYGEGTNWTVQRSLAIVAQGFLNAGLTTDADWKGSLAKTIGGTLDALVKQFGLDKAKSLADIDLCFTDDVEFAWDLGAQYGDDGPVDWWDSYGRKDAGERVRLLANNVESRHTPPIAAFGFRTGMSYHTWACADWMRRLAHEFGPGCAGDIMGVLHECLCWIGGVTPGWAREEVPEWELNDDEDDVTQEKFDGVVPKYVSSQSYSVRRLRRCMRVIDQAYSDGTAEVDIRCAAALRAALECAEAERAVENELQKLKDAHPGSFYGEFRLNHVGCFMRFIPPVAIMWTGETGEDPCVRFLDCHWEMIQSDTHSDICFLHGFDVLKEGDGPGTVSYAIFALQRILSILAPLERLLTLLDTPAPEMPPAAPRRRRRKNAPSALLIDIFRPQNGGDDDTDREEVATLCVP